MNNETNALKISARVRIAAIQPEITKVVLDAVDANILASTVESLFCELLVLRAACDAGAVLSRRIKDQTGRVRHADQIVDDMLKMIEGE